MHQHFFTDNTTQKEEFSLLLAQPKKIVITTHQNPDGDAMGSSLGLAGVLKKMGHQVVIAENGEQVLALLDKDNFDIVLMDIQMPVMSGDQATKLIREKERQGELDPMPIIALTAHAMNGDREKYLSLGMNGYVTKPINREALMKEVWEALN